MKCNGNFKQWFNVFLVNSEAWQGYESKTWEVLNHHPQLQLKMFSRTWDFPKLPTQGWVDTAFCTIKWNRTYEFQKKMLAKDIEVDLQDKY